MKKLWILMLVLLAVVAAQAQDGYWKQFDKEIEEVNNGAHFSGVLMDGEYGRFTMRSKLLEHGQRGYYTDHKDCYGEWLYCIITYTEPLKYYAPGDTITSTYQTTTTHSDRVCGVWFADGPGITGDIWTVQNSSGTFLSNVRLENKEGNRYVNPQRKDNHYTDVKETVSAVIPKGNSRDSVMAIYFGFAHGRGEDAVYIRYYYKWTEGSKPVEKLYSTDEMLKQEKKSGPGKWIWIPVVVGIGSIGVGTAGGGIYWLRRRRKKPTVKFTDEDKEELRKLHRDYQDAQLEEGRDAMKWDGVKGAGEWTAWGLDVAGDVAIGAVGAIGGPAGLPIQLKLTAAKSFLAGLSKDWLANDEGFVKSVFMNLPKTGIDTAKAAFTGGATFGGYTFAQKVGWNVGIDTVTSFADDLSHGKSLGESTKNAFKTAVKSTVGSSATTGIADKVPWLDIARAKIADQATEKAANMTTDTILDSFFNWVGLGD
ncbi:MAG: hypothetical protein J6M19_05560 [Bacteroidaceae bacterium]|nr:hypothetical protein [Bacteroidaceae bacterium]